MVYVTTILPYQELKILAEFKKEADKAGVNFKTVESADDVVDYVNEKNGDSGPRSKDLVSNFDYVGHATPGDLDLGWENHGAITSAYCMHGV
jgi:hypothetical protein